MCVSISISHRCNFVQLAKAFGRNEMPFVTTRLEHPLLRNELVKVDEDENQMPVVTESWSKCVKRTGRQQCAPSEGNESCWSPLVYQNCSAQAGRQWSSSKTTAQKAIASATVTFTFSPPLLSPSVILAVKLSSCAGCSLLDCTLASNKTLKLYINVKYRIYA